MLLGEPCTKESSGDVYERLTCSYLINECIYQQPNREENHAIILNTVISKEARLTPVKLKVFM